MKIIVFGATGTVGKLLIEQGLEKGHTMTAFSRGAMELESHPNLHRVSGDVMNPDQVANQIKGQDAVVVVLGSKKLTGTVRSEGTRNIIQAMEKTAVRRLICQSTLGAGDSWSALNFFWKRIMFGFILRSVFKDHERQEALVKRSDLDWTIVRPSAFTDDLLQGSLYSGDIRDPKHLQMKIPRSELASFIINEIDSREFVGGTPGLSY